MITRYSGVFEYDGKIKQTPYFFSRFNISDYIFMYGSRWDIKGKLLYVIRANYKQNWYSMHE